MNKKNKIEKLVKKMVEYQSAINRFQKKISIVQKQLFDVYMDAEKETHKKCDVKRYLSTSEVCELLGVSKSTLYRMRKNEELIYIQIAGKKSIRYDYDEVIKFMDKSKQKIS